MMENKYIYAQSDALSFCIHYLFDNSMMAFSPEGRFEECNSLFEVFLQNRGLQRDFFNQQHHQEPMQRLIDFGVIIENNGVLSLNQKVAYILRQLHDKEVLCSHHCPDVHEEIEKLMNSGDLRASSTLFSEPEQEYLDYILNKSTFSDGLDLRNKYAHGTIFRDDRLNSRDYLEFLIIIV